MCWGVTVGRKDGHRRFAREESGQALIIVVVAMMAILAIAALVLDAAELAVARHQAQVAADAGALAGAQEMENADIPASTVTTEGTTLATDNYPGSTVTISQPDSGAGYEVKAVVTAPVKLPFGELLGVDSGTVTAASVAQVSSTAATVGDSNITDLGCGTSEQICTFLAGQTVPDSDSGSAGSWAVTSTAEHPTTAYNPVKSEPSSDDSSDGGNSSDDGKSSVNRQPCNGGNSSAACFAPGSTASSVFEVMDLNGQTEGGMWQTVSTVPGARYVVSFWLAGNPGLQGYPSPSNNAFPLDVYITDGADTPYTPSTTELDACTDTSEPSDYIQCGYWDYSNEDVSGEEDANFTNETLLFTAQSRSTTITFNSETYDADSLNFIFCGPQVTNIDLAFAGVELVQ